jgi:hypothetical protein
VAFFKDKASMRRSAVCFCLLAACSARLHSDSSATKPGFVVHFDFISNIREGRDLVRIAAKAGAEVINVVPPAHIWENKLAAQMLDGILDEISSRNLSFVITRIDAAFPPSEGRNGRRFNYLYGNILTDPGVLPNGRKTAEYFRTTIGRRGYAEWMEEETRYYGEHCGRMPNLLGINLGPFSEPFSAERCGFVEYGKETRRYEITQYIPEAARWFQTWLLRRYGSIRGINAEYGSSFASPEEVPLPLNETDSRFGSPELAYFDFARSLNDWLVERYETCRRIWHAISGRADVPLILQHCTGFPEKLVKGRPAFAAFDIPGWIYMADAVGLSLYTNSGFPDFGHASIRAAVHVAALANDLHKPVFVLEGGTEAPNVILDPGELQFYGSVARSLNPQTYIYEFLKDKFDESFESNPGKLVTSTGVIRRPAFQALQELFQEIKKDRTPPEAPEIYFVPNPMAVRGNSQYGDLSAALYDIASDVNVRWVPREAISIIRPGIPTVNFDGSVSPPDANLSRLLQSIPDVDAPLRESWRRAVIEAIRKKTM